MDYSSAIDHVQRILNSCGDPVVFEMTGHKTMSEFFKMSIEIKETSVLKKNNCCELATPFNSCPSDDPEQMKVNRIRISQSMAQDYSNRYPWEDDALRDYICKSKDLFAWFE